ncbi:transcriptional regulator, TetR family [Klenkia marina]|uniref:Transcriptional regulator, TetR family n=1 Tax=Klenkia marina TaxID=1960309 RepID=A0A1G4XGL4_9ACTN|nr:TetR-like C-terminal domain-containing protein [Klenkia marina]SCX40257.1 transcriptional regulator, TetR family [Klenkia marina]
MTTDLSPRADVRSPGRPLSPELSEQLVSVAVDILADEGWGRLNSDRVAARARAGKAGIYRRWPTMAALVRHAVSGFDLVPRPADTGSLRGDLLELVAPFGRPLDREERAVAGLVGAARHDDDLRAGLDTAVVGPLGAVVEEVLDRAERRGEGVSATSRRLLGQLLLALWWDRYTAFAEPLPADELAALVDGALLPVVGASGR